MERKRSHEFSRLPKEGHETKNAKRDWREASMRGDGLDKLKTFNQPKRKKRRRKERRGKKASASRDLERH